MYMYDSTLILISVFFMVIAMLVSWRLKAKFAMYSEERLSSGLSGKEVAEKMLKDNGIYDVRVISVEGQLTDHYNPLDKTVNLSHDVYHGRHVAAAAVAAHECGHAVQHAEAYAWLDFRSKMVPVVQIASTLMSYLSFALALGFYFMPHMGNALMLTFIICQGIVTLFSVVTLPVEVDASRRALAWLNQSMITRGEEDEHAKDALKWAAYTYFVSALGAIATLIYMILRFSSRRED